MSASVVVGMAVRMCEGVRSAAKAVQTAELESDAAKDLEVEMDDVMVLGVFVLACATGFDAFGWMALDRAVSRCLPLFTPRKSDHPQLQVMRKAHNLDENHPPMRLRYMQCSPCRSS